MTHCPHCGRRIELTVCPCWAERVGGIKRARRGRFPPFLQLKDILLIEPLPAAMTYEEDLLREIFGPPPDGTLVLRGGGWTICPFEHGDGFAITPPVVPQ